MKFPNRSGNKSIQVSEVLINQGVMVSAISEGGNKAVCCILALDEAEKLAKYILDGVAHLKEVFKDEVSK